LGMVLSVCICWFHSMVTLPPRLVSTDFGTCSYQCFAIIIIIIIIITLLLLLLPRSFLKQLASSPLEGEKGVKKGILYT
jgi:hypothetical protein